MQDYPSAYPHKHLRLQEPAALGLFREKSFGNDFSLKRSHSNKFLFFNSCSFHYNDCPNRQVASRACLTMLEQGVTQARSQLNLQNLHDNIVNPTKTHVLSGTGAGWDTDKVSMTSVVQVISNQVEAGTSHVTAVHFRGDCKALIYVLKPHQGFTNLARFMTLVKIIVCNSLDEVLSLMACVGPPNS